MLVRAALRIGIHQSVPMLPVVRDRAGIANLLKPSHQPNPDLLHWVETHLLNPYAITAAATVLLVFVPFILLFLQRRGRTASFEPSVTDRTVMLQRVRHMWIGGVLEPSVAGTEHLNLGLHRRPDVINAPSPPASRTYRSANIPPGKTILQIFDEISGGLLILGGPGAGKTTLLLQLAKGLLDRTKAASADPIPIVADLSSWASRQQSLATWLTEEIAERHYRVPATIFGRWLARNKLVLLLDGLDEVDADRRGACVEAINAFRREHGLILIAVCCLTAAAENLVTLLELDEAVELEPPTDSQLDSYLRHIEATTAPIAGIRAALAEDESLRDLLRPPIMLRVVSQTRDLPTTALTEHETVNEIHHRLWDEYINRMFERRPIEGHKRYSQQQAISWLEWLASILRERSQTEFYLDRLTMQWLPPRTRKRWRVLEQLSLRLGEYIRPVEEIHWSWPKLRSRFSIGLDISTSLFSGCFTLIGAIVALFPVTIIATRSWQKLSFLVSGAALGFCCVGIALLSLGWTTEIMYARTVAE